MRRQALAKEIQKLLQGKTGGTGLKRDALFEQIRSQSQVVSSTCILFMFHVSIINYHNFVIIKLYAQLRLKVFTQKLFAKQTIDILCYNL